MTDQGCSYGATVYKVSNLGFTKSQCCGLFPTVRAFELLPYYSAADDRTAIKANGQLNHQPTIPADVFRKYACCSLIY